MISWAVAAGTVTGWLHTVELAWARWVDGNLIWFSKEFVWMAPLMYTVLFLAAGTVTALIAMARPALATHAVFGFAFTTLGVFGLLLPYSEIARIASLVLAFGVASVVARAALRRPEAAFAIAKRTAMVATALTLLVGLAAPARRSFNEGRRFAALPDAGPDSPNVLLVILDTVRAASLSLYDSTLRTTPAIDRWASDGMVFNWAIAPAPWTLPTHGSIFTGKRADELAANWTVPLGKRFATLAEIFAKHGYATAGLVANHHYTAYDAGLDRGFSHYRDYLVAPMQVMRSTSYSQTEMFSELLEATSLRDVWNAVKSPNLWIQPKHVSARKSAEVVSASFLQWREKRSGRPFFAFLNYFDAHQPYWSPDSFPAVNAKGDEVARYENAIAWIDANVDHVLSALESEGELDRTIVIIAADHGELLGERKLWGHAHNVYSNVVHVPLVIRYPARVDAGVRIDRVVSLKDLGATILDLAGISQPGFSGHSLVALAADPNATVSDVITEVRGGEAVDSMFPTAYGDLFSLFDDSLQVILNTSGKEEIFRYRSDPRSTTDLLTSGPLSTGAEQLLNRARGLFTVNR